MKIVAMAKNERVFPQEASQRRRWTMDDQSHLLGGVPQPKNGKGIPAFVQGQQIPAYLWCKSYHFC